MRFFLTKIFLKKYWLAFSCSILILAGAIFYFFAQKKWTEDRKKNLFNLRTSLVEASIQRRIDIYIQILKSAKGFVDNTDTVTRASWKDFIESMEVQRLFPGIQGIGYSIYLKPEEVNAHIKKIRKEGFPEYIIEPAGNRSEYTSIVYIEPFDWRNKRALGFDMFAEPIRKAAMERARDQNVPSLSGKVLLVQETDKDVQPGFLIYIPFYHKELKFNKDAERGLYIKGYVYSPFRAKTFFDEILKHQFDDIDIEIFDGRRMDSTSILYNSDYVIDYLTNRSDRYLEKVSKLSIAGNTWSLYYTTEKTFAPGYNNNLAYSVLLAGLIISVLVFFVIFIMSKRQYESEQARIALSKNAEMLEEANQKLFDQNKQLVKINNDLDNFVYTASHDLKAPIANIEGLILALPSVISEPVQNEEFNTMMKMINTSIRKFKETIQDLADITKVQRNFTEDIERVDVCELVEEVKMSINEDIRKANAVINVDSTECPEIKYSKKNLNSIIYNLMSNAIKYRSPDRRPVIDIKTYKMKDYVMLVIKDNGLGIEQSKLTQIFTMFKRFHDHVEGTGIGLYIVKRIVENNNGKIEVESEPGKGTTFKIYFRNQEE